MPAPEVVEALVVRYGATPFALGAELAADGLLEAMRTLRDAHGYRYYLLASAADRPGELELVHGIRNVDSGDDLFVKVRLPKKAAEVDSLAFVYAGAEWHEREMFDLFGIRFRAHPDARRILMPEDYKGHPLLKDFDMDTPWGYRPSTREENG